MRKIVLSAVVVMATLTFVFSGTVGAQGLKVGYVDLMKVFAKSDRAKAKQQKLEDFFKRTKAQMEAKKDELQRMADDLQKQGPLMSEPKQEARIKEIQLKEVELKLEAQKAERAWKVKQKEATDELRKEIIKIVTQIRKEKGLHLVLNSMSLLSADDALNITDEVIRRYDANKGAAPPQRQRPRGNQPPKR